MKKACMSNCRDPQNRSEKNCICGCHSTKAKQSKPKNKKCRIDKSFLRGMASAIDISGTMYHDENLNIIRRTDAEALAHDWEMVGEDMRYAIGEIKVNEPMIAKVLGMKFGMEK